MKKMMAWSKGCQRLGCQLWTKGIAILAERKMVGVQDAESRVGVLTIRSKIYLLLTARIHRRRVSSQDIVAGGWLLPTDDDSVPPRSQDRRLGHPSDDSLLDNLSLAGLTKKSQSKESATKKTR
jgi:hypothetical protein